MGEVPGCSSNKLRTWNLNINKTRNHFVDQAMSLRHIQIFSEQKNTPDNSTAAAVLSLRVGGLVWVKQ